MASCTATPRATVQLSPQLTRLRAEFQSRSATVLRAAREAVQRLADSRRVLAPPAGSRLGRGTGCRGPCCAATALPALPPRPDFPPATQRAIRGDQSLGNIRVRLCRENLLLHPLQLDLLVGGEILRANFVLGDGDSDGLVGGHHAFVFQPGLPLRSQESDQAVFNLLGGLQHEFLVSDHQLPGIARPGSEPC